MKTFVIAAVAALMSTSAFAGWDYHVNPKGNIVAEWEYNDGSTLRYRPLKNNYRFEKNSTGDVDWGKTKEEALRHYSKNRIPGENPHDIQSIDHLVTDFINSGQEAFEWNEYWGL